MVIIYDGICNLCNGLVHFLMKADKKKQFQFLALQSEKARKLLLSHKFDINHIDTILFFKNNKIFTESDAIIEIIYELGGIWKSIVGLKYIPPIVRNKIYRFIARHRYFIFGKKSTCILPQEKIKKDLHLK